MGKIAKKQSEGVPGWLTDLENENPAYLINLIYFSSRKVAKRPNSIPLDKIRDYII